MRTVPIGVLFFLLVPRTLQEDADAAFDQFHGDRFAGLEALGELRVVHLDDDRLPAQVYLIFDLGAISPNNTN